MPIRRVADFPAERRDGERRNEERKQRLAEMLKYVEMSRYFEGGTAEYSPRWEPTGGVIVRPELGVQALEGLKEAMREGRNRPPITLPVAAMEVSAPLGLSGGEIQE